jgi:23S rRNA (uridine2552-2'-O)-methyltransferase
MGSKRTASSNRWLAEHEADHYVQLARQQGWRSRAIYKLEELDQHDRLMKPGMAVVDLGAAPGGWTQYCAKRLAGQSRIIALDILPMEPIRGVDIIQGDFREDAVLRQLEETLEGQPVDLVLSDIAPNISGVDTADQAASIGLSELALMFCKDNLRPGGDFVVKVFQGEGFDDFLAAVRRSFHKVSVRKPKASRSRSREVYLVARNHRPE